MVFVGRRVTASHKKMICRLLVVLDPADVDFVARDEREKRTAAMPGRSDL